MSPGVPSASSFSVNSLFFSSLSFSLTAAFGAVTAKQWLTEYNNVGASKALHIQGQNRQRKFRGLKTWHLRLIIELLPMLLQASLLLFLVGVVHLLWTWDRRVATIQLVLSAFGVAIYLVTILIGILVPDSPFQTPLSKYLPNYASKVRRRTAWIIPEVKTLISRIWSLPLMSPLKIFIRRFGSMVAFEAIRTFIDRISHLVRQRIGYHHPKNNPKSNLTDSGRSQWSFADTAAAESVVWLLEQAEHPDVTITALDAIPRLPPDLVLSLIEDRDGLMERLRAFHDSLLPPFPSGSGDDEDWTRAWPNKAIVSGTALWHLKKLRPHQSWPTVFIPRLALTTRLVPKALSSIHISKYTLMCNLRGWTGMLDDDELNTVLSDLFKQSAYELPIDIELIDTRNASIGGSLMTSVSSFRLMADAIIQFCCKVEPHSDELIQAFGARQLLKRIQDCLTVSRIELPRDALSHVALMIAALSRCFNRPEHFSHDKDQQLRSLILERFYAVDKGKMILDNVILAFSVILIHERLHEHIDIFRMLLLATRELFVYTFYQPGNPITDPHFPNALLRLVEVYPHDHHLLLNVAEVLDCCSAGDWVSPLHEEYGESIIHILNLSLSSELSTAPSGLLNMMASVSDTRQFLLIVDMLLESHGLHKLLARKCMTSVLHLAPDFIGRTVQLHSGDISHSSLLLEAQLWLITGILPIHVFEWSSLYSSILGFFNRMLEEEKELCWPAYFISAGIIAPNDGIQEPGLSPPLKFIEERNLESHWRRSVPSVEENFGTTWRGEALLMMLKKSRLEVARGNLASDWDDSIFFETSPAWAMMNYYESLRFQGSNGVDWGLLREYFNKVLERTGYTPERLQRGREISVSKNTQGLDSFDLESENRWSLWSQVIFMLGELDQRLRENPLGHLS
ncbi:hypothetical protein FRC02_001828 [Tulasnella sp. 418]|nr:hypothetical protein FRC02_001828 [Tulasnella sp. 418]